MRGVVGRSCCVVVVCVGRFVPKGTEGRGAAGPHYHVAFDKDLGGVSPGVARAGSLETNVDLEVGDLDYCTSAEYC